MPELDVLVPHFRDPEGLGTSLDSVARQTWPGRLRVVIADDGSPVEAFDAAQARAQAFRDATGHEVVVLRSDRNLGRPGTRNRLLDAIDAPFVAWLDAGDLWYPEKLARQFAHLDHLRAQGADPARTWVTCAYDWFQDGRARPIVQETQGDQLRALLTGTGLRAYLWTLLGTAESVRLAGRFDERLTRLQDLDVFISFVRAGGRLVAPPEPEPLCRYNKTHRGRSAAEIHACYRLVLAKNAAALDRYPTAFASELRFRAARLGAYVARGNDQPLSAAFLLLRGALGSPRHGARLALELAARRIGGPARGARP